MNLESLFNGPIGSCKDIAEVVLDLVERFTKRRKGNNELSVVELNEPPEVHLLDHPYLGELWQRDEMFLVFCRFQDAVSPVVPVDLVAFG